MRRILGFDVETIPRRRFLTEADPNGAQPVEATKAPPALHASTAHLVAVNFGWIKNTQHGYQIETDVMMWDPTTGGTEVDMERVLLAEAMERIAAAAGKDTLIVSFNGKQFDLPMLRLRAALLRQPIPRLPWQKLLYPFDDRVHLDLRLLFGNGDRRANGTLQHWAETFGIHAEERGAEVWPLVREGKWSAIADYGHSEGRTLVELYQAVEGVL